MKAVFATLLIVSFIALLASIIGCKLVPILANGFGTWWFWRELRNACDNSDAP